MITNLLIKAVAKIKSLGSLWVLIMFKIRTDPSTDTDVNQITSEFKY